MMSLGRWMALDGCPFVEDSGEKEAIERLIGYYRFVSENLCLAVSHHPAQKNSGKEEPSNFVLN